ncbi:MAG TPA: hypothetical protein VHH91_13215 [Vicinamibacterales bacterium]|jgi:hypothetical protein|nr:hypothetical protein [Vicinamibacterales bacterium]
MSHTREAAHGEEAIEDADHHRRRWYKLRSEPRRRTDFMGLNSTWWMALGWLVLLIVVAFPFPWWW